jgi:hypothetical protein
MAKGNFELLALENPLLDIQGVGYVPSAAIDTEWQERCDTDAMSAATRSCSRSTGSRPTMPSLLRRSTPASTKT